MNKTFFLLIFCLMSYGFAQDETSGLFKVSNDVSTTKKEETPVAPAVTEVKPKPVVPKPLPELEKVKCKSLFEAEVDDVSLSYKTNSPCTEKYFDASTLSLKAKASKTGVDYKRINDKNYIFVYQTTLFGTRATKTIAYNDKCEVESVQLTGYNSSDESADFEIKKDECLYIVNNYKLVELQKKNINPQTAEISSYLKDIAREKKQPQLVTHYGLYKNACKKYYEKDLTGAKTPRVAEPTKTTAPSTQRTR